jgi:hypothetical protein
MEQEKRHVAISSVPFLFNRCTLFFRETGRRAFILYLSELLGSTLNLAQLKQEESLTMYTESSIINNELPI